MVEPGAGLDRVFRALASEPRREILRRTAHGRHTVTQLAEHFDMSLAAVFKHVRVLEEAKLLSHTREGRLHWCEMNPRALAPAQDAIERLRSFWKDRFDALARELETPPPAAPSSPAHAPRSRSSSTAAATSKARRLRKAGR